MSRRDLDSQMMDYLYDELPPVERQAFEARLASDEALRREVEAFQGTRALLANIEAVPAPQPLMYELMREARKSAAPSPKVAWWERLAALLMQPAAATAMLVLIVAFTGVYVMKRGDRGAADDPAHRAAPAEASSRGDINLALADEEDRRVREGRPAAELDGEDDFDESTATEEASPAAEVAPAPEAAKAEREEAPAEKAVDGTIAAQSAVVDGKVGGDRLRTAKDDLARGPDAANRPTDQWGSKAYKKSPLRPAARRGGKKGAKAKAKALARASSKRARKTTLAGTARPAAGEKTVTAAKVTAKQGLNEQPLGAMNGALSTGRAGKIGDSPRQRPPVVRPKAEAKLRSKAVSGRRSPASQVAMKPRDINRMDDAEVDKAPAAPQAQPQPVRSAKAPVPTDALQAEPRPEPAADTAVERVTADRKKANKARRVARVVREKSKAPPPAPAQAPSKLAPGQSTRYPEVVAEPTAVVVAPRPEEGASKTKKIQADRKVGANEDETKKGEVRNTEEAKVLEKKKLQKEKLSQAEAQKRQAKAPKANPNTGEDNVAGTPPNAAPPKTPSPAPAIKQGIKPGTEAIGGDYQRAMKHYQGQRYRLAIKDFKTYLKKNRGKQTAPRAQHNLAKSYKMTNKLRVAVKHYRDLLAAYPAYRYRGAVLIETAHLEVRVGDLVAARRHLLEAAKDKAISAQATKLLAQVDKLIAERKRRAAERARKRVNKKAAPAKTDKPMKKATKEAFL